MTAEYKGKQASESMGDRVVGVCVYVCFVRLYVYVGVRVDRGIPGPYIYTRWLGKFGTI